MAATQNRPASRYRYLNELLDAMTPQQQSEVRRLAAAMFDTHTRYAAWSVALTSVRLSAVEVQA